MGEPRWKLLVELFAGVAWVIFSSWWYTNHQSDPTPWQAIWFGAAVINIWGGLSLIRRSWKEL